LSDPLWDGDDCLDSSGCFALLGMLWFYWRILTRTSKDIEVGMCKNEPHLVEYTAIETLEIYAL